MPFETICPTEKRIKSTCFLINLNFISQIYIKKFFQKANMPYDISPDHNGIGNYEFYQSLEICHLN